MKDIELTDGTTAQVQIAGFYHDEKADGSGKAGITFIFKDSIAAKPMNESMTNDGGWEKSSMRTWLASSGVALFPEDLRGELVEVKKSTNNVGYTHETNCVSETYDKLWLPSFAELAGPIKPEIFTENATWLADIYDKEGTRYKLFQDTDTSNVSANAILVRQSGTDTTIWWERSSFPVKMDNFLTVDKEGYPNAPEATTENLGVIPGFCL